MNIFQKVKRNVTTRQAAEIYGLKVNRNGMTCCPFHRDRHPSMKVDQGFYCFSCGAKGDVITFTSDYFNLSPLEAAKKLAEDFQIPIEQNTKRRHSVKSKKSRNQSKRTVYQTEQKFEKWERQSSCILSDYLRLLEEWKINHAPKTIEEEWKDEFVEACHQKEKITYYLDLLLNGELQDRISFLLENGKDVDQIEKRMEKYRRKNSRKIESGN